MPRLIVTPIALRGLERCRDFLANNAPDVVQRASDTIYRRLVQLEDNPAIGRRLDSDDALRELVIGFGASGYVALYRHELVDDAVYLLAFRHQREAGYRA